jgi:putative toxin-antitoxin system antitoxin component (TIGR02293 family)
LAAQLEHPSANAIWNRALEVFGDETKARSWMNSPRDTFGGRTPQDLVATGDVGEQRRVLETLLRIDYGVFS